MEYLEALAVQAINERFNLRAARLLLTQMKLPRLQRVQKVLDKKFDQLHIPPQNRFTVGGDMEVSRLIGYRLSAIRSRGEYAFFAVFIEGLKGHDVLRNGAIELWKQKSAEYPELVVHEQRSEL